MTNGTRVVDNRYTYPIENGWGVCQPGLLFTKTWSGSDRGIRTPRRVKEFYTADVPFYIRGADGRAVIGGWRKTLRYRWKNSPSGGFLGPNDVHPYECSVYRRFDPLVGMTNVHGYAYKATTSWQFGGPSWDQNWHSADDLKLLSKLRDRLAGSSFNLAVFLAEAEPALLMIATAASKLYRAYHHLVRWDLRGAAQALIVNPYQRRNLPQWRDRKTLAGNWLELQYGWLPLVSDIQAGAEYLAQQLEFPLTQRVAVRRQVVSTPTSDASDSIYWQNALAFERKQIVAYISEVDQLALVGLTDPLSVIWEKTPYSFVADWAIPVGSYLSARGLARALKGTFVTTYTNTEMSNGPNSGRSYVPSGHTDLNFGEHQAFEYYRKTTSRTVSSVLDVPLPTVKPLNQWLSWRRAANAVALLAQRKWKLPPGSDHGTE